MQTKIVDRHTGKMERMISIQCGLVPQNNTFCQKMRKCEGSICQSCFAHSMAHCYKDPAINSWEFNHHNDIEPITLNASFCRFNSFVEIEDSSDLDKMDRIARANPYTRFTLWTKKTALVKRFYKTMSKPKNLRIIYSWPKVERCSDAPGLKRKLEKKRDSLGELFNGIFTVCKMGTFNCGKRKCIDCQRCYGLPIDTSFQFLFEELK